MRATMILSVSAAVVLMACQPKPASVEVNPAELQLTEAQTSATLQATTKDASGKAITSVQVSWMSSDPAVATVDATGAVTAVGSGKTKISAKTGEIIGETAVTVAMVKTVKAEPANAELEVGAGPLQLKASFFNEKGEVLADATRTVAWAVKDTAIATIGEDGTLAAVAPGATTVVLTAGTMTTEIPVTIKAAAAAPVEGEAGANIQ